MDISIIIVSWNVREKLRQNLNALLASVGVKAEIFVVDNNSGDGTVEMLETDFPSLTVIANQENLGFAKACNQGIRASSGRYILLLNPDMKVFPETLAKTVAWLDENTQAAIAGIQLVNENGENIKHVRRFPNLINQLAIVLKLPHLLPRILDSYLRQDFDYSRAAQVDSIRGAFFVIRRSALGNIGLLDERYFLWFEEVDYCRRAKNIELEVWYTPVTQAIDYVGQSFNQIGLSVKQKYFRDSMIAYFKKWQPAGQAWLIRVAWLISSMITALAGLLGISSRTRT